MYHKTVYTILDLIKIKGFWHETFEHQETRTSQESALTRPGYTLNHGAKAMILKIYYSNNLDSFVMLVFPADKKFDSKKVTKNLSAKKVRFASEQEVLELTNGIKIGGVPPFGQLFNLKIFADPSLFKNEKMVFNAGDRCFSVAMRTQDWKNLINPIIIDIIQK